MSTLRSSAEEKGISIGAAVNTDVLKNDPAYAETLTREFTMVTAENAMKFGPLLEAGPCSFESRSTRDAGNYRFEDAGLIVDLAQQHNMKVRGHTLIWQNQLPQWVSSDGKTNDRNWTPAQIERIMEEHIGILAGRYKGRIHAWDVVNEAITEPTDSRFENIAVQLPGAAREINLRRSVWFDLLGPDFIEKAFRLAHQADPEALLFYNDYNGEGQCEKADHIFTLVRYLKEKGVPIHGIGMQMHISLEDHPDPEELAANINRYTELGLITHITELDVRIPGAVDDTKLTEQARIYREVAEVAIASGSCPAIVTWGVTDKYSWIPYWFEGCGAGLLFDDTYNRKPAYDALSKALSA